MENWTSDTEKELTQIIKDWLKQKGKTQAQFKYILNSETSRMPALIEKLKEEYLLGGLPKLASKLCQIESEWISNEDPIQQDSQKEDPFGQLDLVLQEIIEEYDK